MAIREGFVEKLRLITHPTFPAIINLVDTALTDAERTLFHRVKPPARPYAEVVVSLGSLSPEGTFGRQYIDQFASYVRVGRRPITIPQQEGLVSFVLDTGIVVPYEEHIGEPVTIYRFSNSKDHALLRQIQQSVR